MRGRMVSVGFDGVEEPTYCVSVRRKKQFGDANRRHPPVGAEIVRRQPKSFVDMGLNLCPAPHNKLGVTDKPVGVSQIAIQRQRSLALSHALSRAVRNNLHAAQPTMGLGMVRRTGQRLYQHCLGQREMGGLVIGEVAPS